MIKIQEIGMRNMFGLDIGTTIVIIAIFFLCPCGVGLSYIISFQKKKKRCTCPAKAVVIDIKTNVESMTSNGETAYYVEKSCMMRYTVDGKEIVSKGPAHHYKFMASKPGSTFNILYDPDKPEDFIIPTKHTEGMRGWLYIGLGAIATVLAFLYCIFGVYKLFH